jgi:hypothetical protein
MGKKGRRGRARKGQARSASAAPAPLDHGPATVPLLGSAGLVTSAPPAASEVPAPALVGAPAMAALEHEDGCAGASSPPELQQASQAAEASAPEPAPGRAEPPPLLSPEPPQAPSSADSEREPAPEAPEESVPPAGDLDARFFEQSPSEAWLAHELELRDPRFVRKMTANVAQRRAHLARYVVGVVGVAVALCLAALIKSAVPAGDDESRAHPATPMAMPAARPSPLQVPPAAPDEPAATPDGSDGGG